MASDGKKGDDGGSNSMRIKDRRKLIQNHLEFFHIFSGICRATTLAFVDVPLKSASTTCPLPTMQHSIHISWSLSLADDHMHSQSGFKDFNNDHFGRWKCKRPY